MAAVYAIECGGFAQSESHAWRYSLIETAFVCRLYKPTQSISTFRLCCRFIARISQFDIILRKNALFDDQTVYAIIIDPSLRQHTRISNALRMLSPYGHDNIEWRFCASGGTSWIMQIWLQNQKEPRSDSIASVIYIVHICRSMRFSCRVLTECELPFTRHLARWSMFDANKQHIFLQSSNADTKTAAKWRRLHVKAQN